MNETEIRWDVVEEHLDEAAFLWTVWERALLAPDQTLKDVIRGPEERLLAHIDGLIVAGELALERLLVPGLEGDEPEKVFAAALALLDGPAPDAVERVFARLEGPGPGDAELLRALELTHRRDIGKALVEMTRSGSPTQVAAALSALWTRRAPIPGLKALLTSDDPAILAPALRAARGEGEEHLGPIEAAFASEVTAVRDAALETGLVLGLESAWAMCRRLVDQRRTDSAFPLLALAMSGETGDVQRIVAAMDAPRLRRAAVTALGYTGRAAAVEACLPLLGDLKLARLAGEVVTAVTGLALDGPYVKKPEPEPEEPVPLGEEEFDTDMVPGPEAFLPEPEATAVETWWKDAKVRFDPKGRYLGGKPWSAEVLAAAFESGVMRRRHALGLVIAIRSRGARDVETHTWAGATRS